jgi:hypothetical protein
MGLASSYDSEGLLEDCWTKLSDGLYCIPVTWPMFEDNESLPYLILAQAAECDDHLTAFLFADKPDGELLAVMFTKVGGLRGPSFWKAFAAGKNLSRPTKQMLRKVKYPIYCRDCEQPFMGNGKQMDYCKNCRDDDDGEDDE